MIMKLIKGQDLPSKPPSYTMKNEAKFIYLANQVYEFLGLDKAREVSKFFIYLSTPK